LAPKTTNLCNDFCAGECHFARCGNATSLVESKEGCSGGVGAEVSDLRPYSTRDEVAHVVAETSKGATDGKISNFAGQLWALRGRIEPGDLMIMPMKTTKQIALGRVSGPYEYRAHEEDADKRHVVPVNWQHVDLPRSAVKQDLLFTLGSAMSIFSPSKHNAVARLEHLSSMAVTRARWSDYCNTRRRHSPLGGHPPISRMSPT